MAKGNKKKKPQMTASGGNSNKSKAVQSNNRAAAGNAPKKQRKNMFVRFWTYIGEVKREMKKVIWPTKKELGSYTVMVLIICAFFGLAFWAIDSGFLAALKGLLGITM